MDKKDLLDQSRGKKYSVSDGKVISSDTDPHRVFEGMQMMDAAIQDISLDSLPDESPAAPDAANSDSPVTDAPDDTQPPEPDDTNYDEQLASRIETTEPVVVPAMSFFSDKSHKPKKTKPRFFGLAVLAVVLCGSITTLVLFNNRRNDFVTSYDTIRQAQLANSDFKQSASSLRALSIDISQAEFDDYFAGLATSYQIYSNAISELDRIPALRHDQAKTKYDRFKRIASQHLAKTSRIVRALPAIFSFGIATADIDYDNLVIAGASALDPALAHLESTGDQNLMALADEFRSQVDAVAALYVEYNESGSPDIAVQLTAQLDQYQQFIQNIPDTLSSLTITVEEERVFDTQLEEFAEFIEQEATRKLLFF